MNASMGDQQERGKCGTILDLKPLARNPGAKPLRQIHPPTHTPQLTAFAAFQFSAQHPDQTINHGHSNTMTVYVFIGAHATFEDFVEFAIGNPRAVILYLDKSGRAGQDPP
jgi:hypothetical protein